ncbi:adenine phosphoribosyltransferase [bacterium]|nr:adenine phosphoribosyltransferase [bacterium]
MTTINSVDFVKSKIRDVLDFPVKGIVFKDITTVLRDKDGFKEIIKFLKDKFADKNIDYVAGIESRGFIFGSVLAYELGAGFVPLRKPGKLPGETLSQSYELEYGTDTLQIHKDAIEAGKRVVIVDDLLATGGTAGAACKLIYQTGAEVVAAAFVIELQDLKGREKMPEGVETVSMIVY